MTASLTKDVQLATPTTPWPMKKRAGHFMPIGIDLDQDGNNTHSLQLGPFTEVAQDESNGVKELRGLADWGVSAIDYSNSRYEFGSASGTSSKGYWSISTQTLEAREDGVLYTPVGTDRGRVSSRTRPAVNTFPQIIKTWFRVVSLALVLGLGLVGAGCASGPKLVNHSFGFDVLADSPDAQLLDYKYGTSKQPGARPPEWALREGMVRQQAGVTGEMILGDGLYVKWRIKSTGEVLEETVDLKSRLPRDITDHKVYFVIQGRDIYVYLISPELRSRDSPRIGPKVYRDYYKIYQIYPTSTFNK